MRQLTYYDSKESGSKDRAEAASFIGGELLAMKGSLYDMGLDLPSIVDDENY